MENKNNSAVVATGLKEGYEAKVGLEAFARAGRNPNLKGVVHEVLYKDLQTVNPENLAKGVRVSLTKSVTATRDDVIAQQAGKIVGRFQLKDTANSVSHTVKQAASGKYQGSNLMGTKETVQAYNEAVGRAANRGVRVTQQMRSTGISSSDTTRIAHKVVGGKITGDLLTGAAKSSGLAGAAFSGGLEVYSAGKELLDGTIDGAEFAGRVAKETVSGGVASGLGGLAGMGGGMLVLSLTPAAPVAASLAVGIAAATVVTSAVKSVMDSIFSW